MNKPQNEDIYISLTNAAREQERYNKAIAEMAKQYQEAIKQTEELRIEILQDLKQPQHDYKSLFIKAAKCIGLATNDRCYYTQVESRLD